LAKQQEINALKEGELSMRKYTYIGAAAASLFLAAAFAVGPAAAAGGDELTAGGNNVAVGDSITATLSSADAVLSTSIGDIDCTVSSFAATDKTNPAEGVAEATETVNTLSFSSCSTTIIGAEDVSSIGLTPGTAPIATVVDEPSDNPIDLDVTPSVTVVLDTILGSVDCIYSGAVAGAVSNSADTITFTGQTVTSQSGSSQLCPASGSFTATYGSVVDHTMGNKAIVVN
jgi:hypothetical protein